MTAPGTAPLRLDGRSAGDTWRPVIHDAADTDAVDELVTSGAAVFVHDELTAQLHELAAIRNPVTGRRAPGELDALVADHLAGRDPARYGVQVFFPWSRRLVHLLPTDEFREVRTDRNRYKITPAEQERLATVRIGVVGLSVGNAAAVTLALEGVGGTFRLADFDQLGLSNLNRMRGGVHELGVDKTLLAARQLAEIDPWLDVEIHRDGVGPDTVEQFVADLDLVVEECDDLWAKIVVRERARAHRIPVVMDTSDRGLLDVERFDLEPQRPILHGLVGTVRADDLRGMSAKEKLPIVLALVDADRMSTRMAASLPEVGTTIGSWPQLASGVALGGALVTDVARRILVGEHTESGRYYVDPAEIVADGRGLLREPVSPPPPFAVAPEAQQAPVLPPRPGTEQARSLTTDAVRWIAALGTLAPSGHNNQPWALRWRAADGVLECRHDPARDLGVLDHRLRGTWLAFGTLVENLDIAARAIGLRTTVRTWPEPSEPDLVCTVGLAPADVDVDPLFDQIALRTTNRRRDERAELPAEAASALVRAVAASPGGAALRLVTAPGELAALAPVIGAADRVALTDEALHRDTVEGLRWTPGEVVGVPHGLDVATLEYDVVERAALGLGRQWRVMAELRRIGGGRGLETIGREMVATAAAFGMVTAPDEEPESWVATGRAIQRMWLTATSLGLAVAPMTALPYLLARIADGEADALDPRTRDELEALRPRLDGVFPAEPGRPQAFLFRLAIAGPPTARSLRRPLDEVLTPA